ncbi:hypothetical protein V6N12_045330 [Hibiscus sabdariffa]|uniref:Uncharacterized protein n=1 Tax=Hibiscus sabdariffa TaxID=183260 RepID=A0ABR2G2I0_9ROSI
MDVQKTGGLTSSPQSTLSGLGSWSASSNGSPNGPSQVPSPTPIPFDAKNDTWDLISAAAGQVARLKMHNEVPKFSNPNHGRVLPKTQNYSLMNNLSSELYSNQNLSYNLAQSNQTHGRQMKASNWRVQQQQIQCRARNNVVGGLPHSSWFPVQVEAQQPQHTSGSCMRAMFVGGSESVKRGCAGTGVFLPRTYEYQKKSGCSTVVVPTKVVQALNLNFGESNSHVQPHFHASFAPNYGEHVDSQKSKPYFGSV